MYLVELTSLEIDISTIWNLYWFLKSNGATENHRREWPPDAA